MQWNSFLLPLPVSPLVYFLSFKLPPYSTKLRHRDSLCPQLDRTVGALNLPWLYYLHSSPGAPLLVDTTPCTDRSSSALGHGQVNDYSFQSIVWIALEGMVLLAPPNPGSAGSRQHDQKGPVPLVRIAYWYRLSVFTIAEKWWSGFHPNKVGMCAP